MLALGQRQVIRRPKVISAGGRLPENQVSPGARLQCVSNIPFPLGNDSRRIKVLFTNWSFGSLGVVADNPTSVSIPKAALKYNGLTQPILFGGSRVGSMAGGLPLYASDWLSAQRFGLSKFTRDTLPWFRGTSLLPSGTGRHLTGVPATYAGAEGNAFFAYYDPANHIDQIDDTGDMVTPSGATVATSASTYDLAQGWGPCAIIGEPLDRGAPVVIAVGDSLLTGRTDSFAAAVLAGFGPIARMSHPSDGALEDIIAAMNATKSGAWASSQATNEKLKLFYRYFNTLIVESARNDIGTGGRDDAPTVMASRQSIIDAARARGIRKVIAPLVTPWNQTTDDFATNATYVTVNGPSGTDATFNGLQNAEQDAGRVDLVPSYPGIRQDADFYKWYVNGTPGYMVDPTDGLHISPVSSAVIGADNRYSVKTALALPLVTRRFAINCTTKPGAVQSAALTTLTNALEAAGALSGCEFMYLLGAQDQQAGLLNFVAPGRGRLTFDGAPTFTQWSGFTGDGVDDGLNTGIAPSAYTKASLNSMCLVVGILTNSNQTSPVCGTTTGTTAQRTLFFNPHNGGVVQARLNDVTTSTVSTPLVSGSARSDGLWYVNRSASNARQFGKDGVEFATDSAASTQLSASALRFLRGALTTDFSTRKLWFAGVFSDMSGKHAAIYNALSAYKTAMGIA